MSQKKPYWQVSIVLFSIFIAFSYIVYLGTFKNFDLSLTQSAQLLIPGFLTIPFSIFSLIGSLEVSLVFFLILIFFFWKKGFKNSLFIFVIFSVGSLFETVGKFLLYHPAPPSTYFKTVGFFFPSKYIHTDFSYPSGHIFRITLLIFLLIFFLPTKKRSVKTIAALTLFLLIMALSRVYLGEHWFSDVIGGLLLGLSFSALTIFVLAKNQ